MHVVKASGFHHSVARAQNQVRYISHGEKDTPGADKREVYGLGDRYREVSKSIDDPSERAKALEKLFFQDAANFKKPTFHSHIFTLDNDAALRFAGMDRLVAEQRVRAAVNEAFRGSAHGRQLQGIYAIHWDGGYRRAAHPHVHVVYSPARADGRPIYIGQAQLQKLKAGWNRAIDRDLGRTPARTPPRRPRRPPRVPRMPELNLGALRAFRAGAAIARNPARSAVRIAGRAMARAITAPLAPALAAAGVRVPKPLGMVIRLALGKVSIPLEIARAVTRIPFERGRTR